MSVIEATQTVLCPQQPQEMNTMADSTQQGEREPRRPSEPGRRASHLKLIYKNTYYGSRTALDNAWVRRGEVFALKVLIMALGKMR